MEKPALNPDSLCNPPVGSNITPSEKPKDGPIPTFPDQSIAFASYAGISPAIKRRTL